MSLQTVLLPLFVQVALTFVLLLWMGRLRTTAVRSGEVRINDIALREPNWPRRMTQIANAFHNQLELPVLFYVLTVLEIASRHADLVFVVLAWVFVLSRLAHAYVHTTSNVVMRRGLIFGIGAVVLIAMWAIFMIRILFGLP
jgi:hypothetical protein